MKLTLGACQVDLATRVVSQGDEEQRLTSTEVAQLAYLVQHSPDIVSREELYREVWEHTATLQTRTLDLAVLRLRKKIEVDPKNPLHVLTVYGKGYCFVPSGGQTGDFRPVEGGPSTKVRTNLAPPLDSFVGREFELEELSGYFEQEARLVTVKGTGGAGKTRLARRYARSRLEDLSGGAWFIDLTEARTPMGLVQATAMALDVPLGGADFEVLVTQVGHAISGRGPVLLVLDNFEQVVKHAPITLGCWLQAAPEASFLVTSRESLKLEGEQVFPLAPLPEADGVALFESRARAAGAILQEDPRSRDAIVRVVAALDGLPLAIELAAARAVLLSPTQLLERLSERFELLGGRRQGDTDRQSTLRGLIRWSWELLEPWEQVALAQLSVFRDGFFLEAAEEVLDLSAWPDAPWSLDVVGSLLDKSLLHSWLLDGQPRFGMYVSIQDYAAQKLGEESGAMALRHAQHFASFGTEGFLESLNSHGGVERRKALAVDLENLLAGVDTGLAAGEAEVAAGCALACVELFEMHGPYSDGIALLKRVLGQQIGRGTEGRLFRRAAWLLYVAGRLTESLEHHHKALAIAREVGDRRAEGITLGTLAHLLHEQGLIPEAREHYDQALAIACEVGDRWSEGAALGRLAYLHHSEGQFSEALERHQQALAIAREVGDRRGEGGKLASLALLHHKQGRLLRAQEHIQEALAIARELGDRRGEASYLSTLAHLHHEQGLNPAAQDHYQQALVVVREVGYLRGQGSVLARLAHLYLEQGLILEAQEHYQQALVVAREVGYLRGQGIALGNLGDILSSQGDLLSAEAHLRDAITISDQAIPHAAAAFRGTLALLRATQGDFAEARALLAQGEPQLRGGQRTAHEQVELGKFLCKKARVGQLAGDPAMAASALAEAEMIAAELETAADSKFGQALAEARAEAGG
ncbi:MAG: tetratricopeptide repeat protein [Myxococcota bacterium]|nr:tetratricopeptide repeat protein [Myxococcota bacterium]